MNSTACSQCGEKILPHWTLCPVCALPFADAVALDSKAAAASDEQVNSQDLCCIQCKGILSPEAQICPHCHVLIIRRYCSGCSRLIPEQASSCPYCGTSATAKRPRFKFYLQSALILMSAGSVVAGLFFVVYRVPPEPPKSAAPLAVRAPFNSEPPSTISVEKTDQQKSSVEVTEVQPMKTDEDPSRNDSSASVEETNILESIQVEDETFSPVTNEAVPDDNWESRGARLKQGRKLTENASRLMQQGRYTDASIVLIGALKVFPEKTEDLSYGEALYKLGICLRKKGQPEQAIPVLQEAMRFAYYRSKVLREVEAATSQIKRTHQTKGTRK